MKTYGIICRLLGFPLHSGCPHTIGRRGIRLLPNRYGLLFSGVLSAMLIGSVNYNNNFGFLLTFLLGSMMIISWLHTIGNLSGICILSCSAGPVFAGEDAVFEFSVRVRESARQGIRFQFADGTEQQFDFEENSDRRIQLSKKTDRRGMFNPGNLIISTGYPIGLFDAFTVMDLKMDSLVYPKPVSGQLISTPVSASADQDNGADGGKGSDDFSGLRVYQPGDPIRRIAWKAFSRGQGLQTKEFIATVGSKILIDFHSVNEPEPEIKISRLCDMVLKANALRIDYGIRIPGGFIPPDRGEVHKHRCLKLLALIK